MHRDDRLLRLFIVAGSLVDWCYQGGFGTATTNTCPAYRTPSVPEDFCFFFVSRFLGRRRFFFFSPQAFLCLLHASGGNMAFLCAGVGVGGRGGGEGGARLSGME